VDPGEFRARSRERWERVAPGWGARREEFQSGAIAVSRWMVDAINPQPGQAVLELAAGPGDTGLLAAELLRPGGRLISTDGAEAMVELARERARELGLDGIVEARTMEAEWIDLSAAVVDAVLCRWGYMLLADPEAALRETRRILKPGGQVALAVWAAATENPLISTGGRVAVELGLADPPPAGEPGPFALADRDTLEELLAVAGFADIEIDIVEFETRFADLDSAFAHQRDLSPSFSELLPRLTPAEHYAFRDAFDKRLSAFAADNGSVVVPSKTLVAVASA
jgi:SAM-dependent methyltransferase